MSDTTATTTRQSSLFFVRGTDASHAYEQPTHGRLSFCTTCDMAHPKLGRVWHVESEEVDTMLCGVRIPLEDGEVRDIRPKAVCAGCEAKS